MLAGMCFRRRTFEILEKPLDQEQNLKVALDQAGRPPRRQRAPSVYGRLGRWPGPWPGQGQELRRGAPQRSSAEELCEGTEVSSGAQQRSSPEELGRGALRS